MPLENPFKWRQFEPEPILLCVRWYLRYSLSYRDLEEMMRDRVLSVDQTTIYRWFKRYAPEIDKLCRAFLRRTNDSYRINETFIRLGGAWKYLYRAVDSNGDTLDFLLRAKRDKVAATAFFRKMLGASHATAPRVINVDKTPPTRASSMRLSKRGSGPSARGCVSTDTSTTLLSRTIALSSAGPDRCWASNDSIRRGEPYEASR